MTKFKIFGLEIVSLKDLSGHLETTQSVLGISKVAQCQTTVGPSGPKGLGL